MVNIPDNSASFWEGFTDLVTKFRTDCKDLSEGQIYLLCAEPSKYSLKCQTHDELKFYIFPVSRRTFFNNLEEIESEKVSLMVIIAFVPGNVKNKYFSNCYN